MATYEQLETLRKGRVVPVPLGERRHFHRIIGNESRLYEMLLAIFTEDGVNQLAHAH